MTTDPRQEDWEPGKPPFGIAVEAIIRGHARRGYSDGVWFWLGDCTHPMQNAVASASDVEAWRQAH